MCVYLYKYIDFPEVDSYCNLIIFFSLCWNEYSLF